MNAKEIIEIVQYNPELKKYFKEINQEWLIKYFFMTPEDEEIIDHPEKIIEEGGSILFALYQKEVVGTCALIRESNDTFDLVKMGVRESFQGKGIGTRLMDAVITEARLLGAKRITLDTADRLKSAISVYTKAGFVKTSENEVHPIFKRVTFKMEKIL